MNELEVIVAKSNRNTRQRIEMLTDLHLPRVIVHSGLLQAVVTETELYLGLTILTVMKRYK